MKTVIIAAGCTLALILAMVTLRCKAQQPQLITPAQAEAAVCAFESNQSIQFETVTERQNTDGPAWAQYYDYDLTEAGNPTLTSDWGVDAVTGEVIRASHGSAYPADSADADSPFGPLTQAQCQQIASAFVHANYANFGTMGLVPGVQQWQRSGWQFTWYQVVAYGAITNNSVEADINPQAGQIESYFAYRIPTPNPPAPQVTAQQAVDTAVQVTGLATLYSNDTPALTADPDGIYWVFSLGGTDANGLGAEYLVKVDAETGGVLEQYSAGGGAGPNAPGERRSKPGKAAAKATVIHPAAVDLGMTPLGEMVAKLHGASTRWLGRAGAKVLVNGHVLVLKPDTALCECDGRTETFPYEFKLTGGKLTAPARFMSVLRSYALTAAKPAPKAK